MWNTPDPFHGSYDFGDPQSLNRYAYVGNSPVSYNDPTGLARTDNAPLGSIFSSDGPMYDGYATTQPAGVSENPFPYLWDLLRGASRVGLFLASGSSNAATGAMSGFNANPSQGEIDAGNAAEAWSRFASAGAGEMAVHPARKAYQADSDYKAAKAYLNQDWRARSAIRRFERSSATVVLSKMMMTNTPQWTILSIGAHTVRSRLDREIAKGNSSETAALKAQPSACSMRSITPCIAAICPMSSTRFTQAKKSAE